MHVDEAIRSLRATRRYSLAVIDDDLVSKWVDTARWCGSSKNSQPWRLVAVRDPEVLRTLSRLGDHAGHLAECALALVLAATPSPYPFSYAFDLGRMAQCIMLLAHADGVGSCIAVFGPRGNVEAAGALVDTPPGWSADLAIGMGYPTVADGDVPAGSGRVSPGGRLEASELLSWNRFSKADGDAVR